MSITHLWILTQMLALTSGNITQLRNQIAIYECLQKITIKFEICFSELKASLDEYRQTDEWLSEEERNRKLCCIQNQLKDCWTATIQSTCSVNESRLSRWLPVQVLSDLRNDRCRSFVLYPHRCKTNTFSLLQILIFLLGVPFFSFVLIMFVLKWLKNIYKAQ